MRRKIWAIVGVTLYWIMLPAIWVYAKKTKPRARVMLIWQDEVLLVKNWLSAGDWSLPGGGIEHGEQPNEAAVREIAEELGVSIDPADLLLVGENTAVERGWLVGRYYLFALELTEEPVITPAQSEIVDHAWFDFQHVQNAQKGVGSTVKQSVGTWLNR